MDDIALQARNDVRVEQVTTLSQRIKELEAELDVPPINRALLQDLMMAVAHCDEAIGSDGLCNCAYQIGQVLRRLERQNSTLKKRLMQVSPLESILAEVVAWGKATFPNSTDQSKTKHLIKEAHELDQNPVAEEMADVLMLLAHLAAAKHINLADAVRAKLQLCKSRRWHSPDADGVTEHRRTN